MRALAGPSRRRTHHRRLRAGLAAAGLAGLLLTLTGAVAAAAPATLYVDRSNRNCSNSGPGSAASPYCSIAKAAAVAGPGQTVLVAAGTYAESVAVARSGTATAPIVLKASGGVTVSGGSHGFTIASRSWVTVQGFTVSGTSGVGIDVRDSSHVTVTGNRVTRSGRRAKGGTAQGIRLAGTDDSVVFHNVTFDNSEAGIALTGGSTRNRVTGNRSYQNARGYTRAAPGIDVRAPGNQVIGNLSYHNEDSGIQSYTGGSNTLVAGNLAWDNGDHGIDDLNVPGQRIVGNTVFHNLTAGINVEGNSPGATIANNVSVDNGLASPRTKGNIRVDQNSVSGTRVDRNLVWLRTSGVQYTWKKTGYSSLAAFHAATGQEAGGLQASPGFVNAGAGNFHLAAGSRAIDSADSGVSGQQPRDADGRPRRDDPGVANSGAGPRRYDDRGAYEH
jgi:parallel beta-helix repeat protein